MMILKLKVQCVGLTKILSQKLIIILLIFHPGETMFLIDFPNM